MPLSVGAHIQSNVVGRRLAVVVGVDSTHSSLLAPLSYANSDAQEIADVLQQCCEVELLVPPLLGEQATSAAVKRAVLDLARDRGEDDLLLFYFSGHGQQVYDDPAVLNKDGSKPRKTYLGTADFVEQDVEDDPTFHVSLRWIREHLFERTRAGQVLILLDCCYAEDVRTTPDHSLEELLGQLAKYFEIPGAEVGKRRSALRAALAAAGYDQAAGEQDGHGRMTRLLLQALRGEVTGLLENDGRLTLDRTKTYVQNEMSSVQRLVISYSNSSGKECVLARYPELAEQLQRKSPRILGAERPSTYIPFPRNPLFQPRPGEFESLEALLVTAEGQGKPLRLGLVGVVGMGGIGKTQLAVELAYRSRGHFPSGIFWIPATGKSLVEWQQHFAELAFNSGYLPPRDDVSHPENEARRARHFCHYLVKYPDALLILDNVEVPGMVLALLTQLAGEEVNCTILYTSRNLSIPPGVVLHTVERLPEDAALRLLLETTRPALLAYIETGRTDDLYTEAEAARFVCTQVEYLPLALQHLRGFLHQDRRITLFRLKEVLMERGALSLSKMLSTTFQLSWDLVQDEEARRLFKLATYFPEATLIPLWLVGLAAGLGEGADIFEPLGQASHHLRELSLMEELTGEQCRLHPLVREFGQRLVAEDGDGGKALLDDAAKRLVETCTNLNWLEQCARHIGYHECLQQIRALREYAVLLGTAPVAKQIQVIERWLDRESYLLADERWWPNNLPGLFYQQIINRSMEESRPLSLSGQAPAQWLQQTKPAGVEDHALLHVFIGHLGPITHVAFSRDGKQVLIGSGDPYGQKGGMQVWEVSSGREVARFEVPVKITHVAFSSDGKQVLTFFGSSGLPVLRGIARLWEVSSGREVARFEVADPITHVALSRDGRQVLIGSGDPLAQKGGVQVWEVSSGREVARFEVAGQITSVAFSPDTHLAIITNSMGWIFFWKVSLREPAHLVGIYVAAYEIQAIYWRDASHMVLADQGGPQGRPYFYELTLIGM